MKTTRELADLFLSFILLSTSIMFFSCDSQKVKYFVDEETKAYCYFENGMSYMFKDSVTGEINKLTIDANWVNPKQTRFGEQEISTDVYWDDEIAAGYRLYARQIGYDQDPTLSFVKFSPNNNSGYVWLSAVVYNSDTANLMNEGHLTETLTSLQVENNTYYDVKKFELEDWYYRDSTISFSDSICGIGTSYWARNVGLVRFEFYNDSITIVKNLISYEIPE